MNKNLSTIFNNLKGNWLFDRTILNITNNTTDLAKGKASFTLVNAIDQHILSYEEIGILSLSQSSKQIKFNRKYVYQLKDDAIHIWLNDGITKGDLFQTLLTSNDNCSFVGTEHICRGDKHNGKYLFKDEFSFETAFSILGSTTNLQIVSFYKKNDEITLK